MPATAIIATISRTGPFAPRGRDYERSYSLWAEHANARGGILGGPVALHIADDGSSAERAAALYRTMAGEHAASAMFGPCHTRLADAVIDAAEAIGRPLLQATHGAGEVFDRPRRWHFLCWPGCDRDYPLPWLRHCAAHGMKRIAILATAGRIGAAVRRGVHDRAESLGLNVAADAVIDEAADYDALIGSVGHADTLLIGIDHGRADDPLRQILRAAANAGMAPSRIWVSENPSPADERLGDLVEGVAMRVTWVPERSAARSKQFVRAFEERFDCLPGFHAAGAYACAEVLEQAAAHAGSVDAERLRAALTSSVFDTVVGTLRFQGNGRPGCELALARWRDGRLHILEDAA